MHTQHVYSSQAIFAWWSGQKAKCVPEADVRTIEPPFWLCIIAFAAPFRMLKEDQVLACRAVLNCSNTWDCQKVHLHLCCAESGLMWWSMSCSADRTTDLYSMQQCPQTATDDQAPTRYAWSGKSQFAVMQASHAINVAPRTNLPLHLM